MNRCFLTIRGMSCLAALVSVAGASMAAPCQLDRLPITARPTENAPSAADALALVEAHVFGTLTPEQQKRVVAAGAFTPQSVQVGPRPASYMTLQPVGEEGYRAVRRVLSREVFESLKPVHQHALVTLIERQADGLAVPAFCFSPDTDQRVVEAFNRATNLPFSTRFQQAGRWSSTATDGSGLTQGSQCTIRYSFVPDGTIVPTLASGVTAPSDLFARMNTIYAGNTAAWQALYTQVFNRWGDLIGVSYVFEPNDDGIEMGAANSSGVIGVRGDVRLAGTPLDGNSGVLAFNYYPASDAGGDMVVDTNDTFYNTITTNSLRLRNVLAHEHGHGLGMAHVCPVAQNKLMEPFVSTAYDGPRFDDILNGQRHYGDQLEPNDTAPTATVVSNLASTPNSIQQISCDSNTDADYFRFTLANGVPALFTVTATPIGSSYIQGPQTSACDTGTAFDPLTINPLTVTILSSDGTTQEQSVTASLAGLAASAQYVAPSGGGTYYARVSAGPANNIQAYQLTYQISTTPTIVASLVNPVPTLISPSASTPIQVRISVVADTISSANLFYRNGGSTYSSVPLSLVAGDVYSAQLPPGVCGSPTDFYISVAGAATGTVTVPSGAPTARFTAVVGAESTIFSDNFDTDTGWTYGAAGDTATTGIWTRENPNGTAAQPENAASPSLCAFTGQSTAGSAVGTNDVDSGFTTLISPAINLSGVTSPRITYQRWFSNNAGANPNAKLMRVDISNDNGVNWVNAETLGPSGSESSGGWRTGSINVTSFFPTPGTQVRVRFVPDDSGAGSIVEAAVDDLQVLAIECQSTACAADFDGVGGLTTNDVFAFLNAWFAGNPNADFDGVPGLAVQDIFTFLNLWFAGCP